MVEFFDNPAKVCGALSSLGLGTANRGGWKPDPSAPGEWICATDYLDIGEPVSELRLPTNISFYVFGDGPRHSTKISFILNVNNPGTQNTVLGRLKAAVTKLYSEFGRTAPKRLVTSILKGTPYSAAGIRFEKNTYRIVEFKLSLIDSP